MATSIRAAADAAVSDLRALPALPGIVGLGEPTHDEPAYPRLWSQVLTALVGNGVRSVVLESDAVATLTLDAWVRGGPGRLDDVLATGISHGFGARPGIRELVAGLRVRNDELPPADRVAVHGMDLPTDVTAPSPRRYLEHLHTYLADGLGPVGIDAAELDRLLGPDEPWATWDAQVDASRSVGGTGDAVALRAVADDLVSLLHAEAPHLVATTSATAWEVAERHGRIALGLLRYHAAAARTAPTEGARVSRMLGVRDAEMARNLLAIRAREHRRGPTVVLAHDGHLQLARSTWDPGDPDRAWSWASAGAIVAAVGDEEYVHVAGPAEVPGPDEPEDATVPDLAAFLLSLPGVTHLRADAAAGAPAVAHGDWFFYARPDDRMPFATIVVGDYPGFDETSRLDRPGVFRLNLHVGRGEMTGPADPAELDRFLPHPVYAPQGWVAVLNPGAARWGEIDRLARVALARVSS